MTTKSNSSTQRRIFAAEQRRAERMEDCRERYELMNNLIHGLERAVDTMGKDIARAAGYVTEQFAQDRKARFQPKSKEQFWQEAALTATQMLKQDFNIEAPDAIRDGETLVDCMSPEYEEKLRVAEKQLARVAAERAAVFATALTEEYTKWLVSQAPPVHEKTTFDVVLVSAGANRIQTIKAIRELTGLGLKEAKDLTEMLPSVIKNDLIESDAKQYEHRLREAGATVELR